MNWITIDFEASCLPQHGRSFPIEVGVCGAFGSAAWLIKPAPEWEHWDWTDEAFALHGIGRELLDRQGVDPALVVDQLGQVVGEARIIADSTIDGAWWQTLIDAAGPDLSNPPFVIEHVSDVLNELQVTDEQIRHAQQRADQLCPNRHRASADARWLFTLLSDLAPASVDLAQRPFPSWTSRDAYVRGASKPKTAREEARVLR